MDEENQINDKLKIMKFSFVPCGLEHTPCFLTTKCVVLSSNKVQTMFLNCYNSTSRFNNNYNSCTFEDCNNSQITYIFGDVYGNSLIV